MSQQAQMRIATVVIVLVLGLQFLAVILTSGKWGWPFIDYPMYAQGHQELERVSGQHFIFATTEDGQEREITAEDLDVNLWLFEKWGERLISGKYKEAVTVAREPSINWRPQERLKSTSFFRWLKGKEDPNMHSVFLAMLEQKLGVDIVRLRVEDTPYMVTRRGMTPAPPRVVIVDLGTDQD